MRINQVLKGFDVGVNTTKIIPKIKKNNISFVGRYYSYNSRKNLSLSEARALSKNDIKIVSVWEANGDHVGAFSRLSGVNDSVEALVLATSTGQPRGSCIYFAVDFDASNKEIADNIIPYFKGVNYTIGDKYKIGVYGSGLVCRILLTNKLVEYAWLSGSSGWRESRSFISWNIRQKPPSDIYKFGFDVDPDEGKIDTFPGFGGWLLG